jgi:hypothetical protein
MTRRRFAVVLAVTLAYGAAAPRAAGQIPAGTTALEGTPQSRVETSADRTTREALKGDEATRRQLRIRVDNGRFFWSSRHDEPLSLTAAGEYTYLSSNEPGHYVRIRRINDRLTYVEHLDTPVGSVTYWGELRIVLGKR